MPRRVRAPRDRQISARYNPTSSPGSFLLSSTVTSHPTLVASSQATTTSLGPGHDYLPRANEPTAGSSVQVSNGAAEGIITTICIAVIIVVVSVSALLLRLRRVNRARVQLEEKAMSVSPVQEHPKNPCELCGTITKELISDHLRELESDRLRELEPTVAHELDAMEWSELPIRTPPLARPRRASWPLYSVDNVKPQRTSSF